MKTVLSSLLMLALLTPAPVQAQKIKDTIEVTAKLVKIPGKLPPDELYDYAYVMQYQVLGGKLDRQMLYVAHYKPRQPRSKIKDKMKQYVAGSLMRFTEGELHKMLLAPKIKKVWKGAVVDEFFATDRKSPRHFCLRVDPARK